MKKLGIIGGLGPMATVYFMELIIKMTDVCTDQEHIKVCLQSIPDTPDRTDYICGISDKNPLPYLEDAGKILELQGVDFIAIPCVTAQYFYNDLSNKLNVPVIPLIRGLVEEIKEKGIDTVGIMATNGTIQSKVLQDEFNKKNINVVFPTKEGQDSIMDIIYNQIKAGRDVNIEQFNKVGEELRDVGAKRIIIGCTELSLIKRDYNILSDYVDVLDILAKNAVEYSGAPLKEEYKYLI